MSKNSNNRTRRGLSVEVRHDDFNRALRTWSKKVQESGLIKEIKDRMSYEPPAVKNNV